MRIVILPADSEKKSRDRILPEKFDHYYYYDIVTIEQDFMSFLKFNLTSAIKELTIMMKFFFNLSIDFLILQFAFSYYCKESGSLTVKRYILCFLCLFFLPKEYVLLGSL